MTEAVSTTTEAAPAPVGPTLDEVVAEVFGPNAEPMAAAPSEKETPAAEVVEKVEEKPEEAKPDRVGTRLAAAKRAEQKAERERIELRQQREAQEKRNAELDAREKRLRIIEEDPVKFFEEFKADPKTFLDKLAGEYKPESVATRKATAAEERIEKLEAKLAEKEQAEQQAQLRAQADSAWKEASASFIKHVGEQADKYPSLVEEFSEAEATDLALKELTAVVGHNSQGRPITRTQAYFAEHGVYPDHDVVAEHLNALAKQRIESRAKAGWRSRGESADSASKASLSGDSKPVPSVKGTSPRTLSSRDTNQRASAPKPWTQEEADAESIRILEAALRKRA